MKRIKHGSLFDRPHGTEGDSRRHGKPSDAINRFDADALVEGNPHIIAAEIRERLRQQQQQQLQQQQQQQQQHLHAPSKDEMLLRLRNRHLPKELKGEEDDQTAIILYNRLKDDRLHSKNTPAVIASSSTPLKAGSVSNGSDGLGDTQGEVNRYYLYTQNTFVNVSSSASSLSINIDESNTDQITHSLTFQYSYRIDFLTKSHQTRATSTQHYLPDPTHPILLH